VRSTEARKQEEKTGHYYYYYVPVEEPAKAIIDKVGCDVDTLT
jgi:hypothetical protein